MPLTTLPRKLLTLAFIVRERVAVDGAAAVLSTAGDSVAAAASSVNEAKEVSEVLLGEKKRGFGKGKWNGFGGKVDASDASIVAAAAREIQEEANVTVHERDLEHRGVLLFTFEGGKEVLVRDFVRVAVAVQLAGHFPHECDKFMCHACVWLICVGSPCVSDDQVHGRTIRERRDEAAMVRRGVHSI
jgi:8-oxo-dGTP pyrophosphatase MutT (NUDIX family)